MSCQLSRDPGEALVFSSVVTDNNFSTSHEDSFTTGTRMLLKFSPGCGDNGLNWFHIGLVT